MSAIKKKISSEHFRAVSSGLMPFGLYKDDDNAQPGDVLELYEWTGNAFTGAAIRCQITYVLRSQEKTGLADGFCILGLKAVSKGHEKETEIGPIEQQLSDQTELALRALHKIN